MKRYGYVLVLGCLLLVNVGSTSAQDLRYVTSVPLLDCDGTPCVEAQIGKAARTVRLGIDTGNVNSVVNTEVAEAAGLQATGSMPPGAPEGMFRTEIGVVQIGEIKLEKLPALAMGLGAMIAQKQMPQVDGTLAYTAFKGRAIQLDFIKHQLRISGGPTGPPAKCESDCDSLALVNFGNDGPPVVVAEGFAVNGKKVTAQLDTMYTGSLLVYGAAIEKLELSAAAKTTKVRKFPFTDGGVEMKEAAGQKLSFHGVALGGMAPMVYFPAGTEVHEPDELFEATVGLEMLAGTVVTLDFRDMKITLRK